MSIIYYHYYSNNIRVIGKGLRSLISKIDKDADWVEFVRLCAERSGRVQKSEYLTQDYMV